MPDSSAILFREMNTKHAFFSDFGKYLAKIGISVKNIALFGL